MEITTRLCLPICLRSNKRHYKTYGLITIKPTMDIGQWAVLRSISLHSISHWPPYAHAKADTDR